MPFFLALSKGMALSKNEPSFLSFLNMASGTKLSFHSSELWADRVPLRLGFTGWILWKSGCRGHSDIDITIGHSEVEITRAQMGYSLGTSHGEENGEVPSLSISEHHRPRAIELHKGHILEQLLAGIRIVLQGNVLLTFCVNLSVRAFYRPGLTLGPLDLEKHLRRPERPGGAGGRGSDWAPVKAVYISCINIIVSCIGTISYTASEDLSSSGMPWEHTEKRRLGNIAFHWMLFIHSFIQWITLLFSEDLSSA